MRTARFLAVLLLVTVAFAQGNKANRPSPPGSAEATVGGKKVHIDYSRPKVQDPETGAKRKMIGAHDPYGQVWRTGANEATTFVTEGDVSVGGTRIPAGSYTLYTLPEADKWTLIVSKKTGQWGIPYPGASFDLARIPMNAEKGGSFVDQFTISLEPRVAGAAQLVLAWEDWMASVRITPAK